MATGTGLDAQIGLGIEASYGQVAVPSAFYEFNSESIEPTVTKLYSRPLGGGRFQRAARVRTAVTGAAGDITLDLVTHGLGKLFLMMFGAVDTQQVGGTDEYVHTFTPDADGLRGTSATVQVGRPSTDGVVHPFTYVGGKVTQWEIAAQMDAIATLKVTWDFQGVDLSQPLAVPSYPAEAQPFTFLDGSLTLDGQPFGTVRSVTLTGANALNTDRRSFGGVKREPLANNEWAYTGTFESEFESRDAYDAWVTGEQQANLILTFLGGTIPDTSNPYQLVITIPVIEYTGEAPTVDGPDVVAQNLPFKALWNGTDPIISLEYHTTDVTP